MTSDDKMALIGVVARYSAAQTNIVTAILGTLIRQNILSAEIVEREILDGIRNTFLPLAQSDDPQSADSLEAQATLRLNARIRSVLFGVHEA